MKLYTRTICPKCIGVKGATYAVGTVAPITDDTLDLKDC